MRACTLGSLPVKLATAIVATFKQLIADAGAAGEPEPTAMTLATCAADGTVSARTVLLKAVDERGFVFYTNTESLKGRQLGEHARAALLFHWKHLRDGVQVRIEGAVEAVSAAEADAYFATRPRESQIGAWASIQSAPLASREVFEERIARFEAQFAGRDVPRPPHWSGYRVRPQRVEFWYGVRYRLHDRHLHEWRDGAWQHTLLFP